MTQCESADATLALRLDLGHGLVLQLVSEALTSIAKGQIVLEYRYRAPRRKLH